MDKMLGESTCDGPVTRSQLNSGRPGSTKRTGAHMFGSNDGEGR
jgi:hypothetical protein